MQSIYKQWICAICKCVLPKRPAAVSAHRHMGPIERQWAADRRALRWRRLGWAGAWVAAGVVYALAARACVHLDATLFLAGCAAAWFSIAAVLVWGAVGKCKSCLRKYK